MDPTLFGQSFGAVPGVVQASGTYPLQGSSGLNLQGSSGAGLQGSSGAGLQQTANPNYLPANSTISLAGSVPNTTKAVASTPVTSPVTSPVTPPVTPTTPIVYPDLSGDITSQLNTLNTIKNNISSGNDKINNEYKDLFGQYNSQAADYQKQYNDNSNNNKINYQANTQAALSDAAQGRQGLFSLLNSMGALNGSGITLANNAVQNKANTDLGLANNTYGANQSGLDQAWGDFNKLNNQTTLENQIKQQQDLDAYKNTYLNGEYNANKAIYNDYMAENNKTGGMPYLNAMQSLIPQIGSNQIATPITPSYKAVAYTPPTLSKYIGPNVATTKVATTPTISTDNPIPGLIAASPFKKLTTS